MKENCLGTIRSIYSKLSEKEKKIADYILEHPESVIHQAINEVADYLHLADATVFRFSKRLGFKGFQAMKIALASEIMSAAPNKNMVKPEKKDDKNPVESLFQTTLSSIEKTYQGLDHHALSKAAEIIRSANRVQFFGTGASAILALDSFHTFSHAGIRASAFLETQFQFTTAAQLTQNDAAVVISQSGTSSETLAIVESIQKTGASIITITGSSQSPVSLHADIALYSFTTETNEIGMLSLRSAQLSLLHALYVHTVSIVSESKTKPHSL